MDEIKRITSSFCEKAAELSPIEMIQNTFIAIEDCFKECNEELAAAGMPECSYAFQPEAISEVVEDMVPCSVIRRRHTAMSMKNWTCRCTRILRIMPRRA